MKNPAKEAVLEALRVISLAFISYLLISGVLETIIVLLFGEKIQPELKTLLIGLVTTILRAVDKFIHEFGKEKNDFGLSKGLTQF